MNSQFNHTRGEHANHYTIDVVIVRRKLPNCFSHSLWCSIIAIVTSIIYLFFRKKLSPTVAELLKQQTESTAGTPNVNGISAPDINSQSSQEVNDSSQDEAIDSAIDSVMAMSRNNKLDDVFDSVIGMNDSDSKDMDDEKKTESVPKLPDGLSADFVQILDKLKQVHITFTVKSLVFVGC